MVVSADGNTYVGNFGFDVFVRGKRQYATLGLVRPDGTVEGVAGDLDFPNGSVISPDGRTLIVGETIGRRYTGVPHRPTAPSTAGGSGPSSTISAPMAAPSTPRA